MNIFGRSVGGGRRRSPRDPALVLAEISTVDDDRRVAVLNVSRRGARLAAPDLPTKGADVILHAARLEAFGHVIWSQMGQCGILFEPPISATDVAELRTKEVRIAA